MSRLRTKESKGGFTPSRVGVIAVAFCPTVLLTSNSRDWEKSEHMARYDRIYFQRLTMGLGKREISEVSPSVSFYVRKPPQSL